VVDQSDAFSALKSAVIRDLEKRVDHNAAVAKKSHAENERLREARIPYCVLANRVISGVRRGMISLYAGPIPR